MSSHINKKKIFNDFFLNFISGIIVIAVIQLLIFPYLSRELDATNFGNIIAIYGFISVVVSSTGNSLNNVKLLSDNKNSEEDFSRLLIVACVYAVLILCFLLVIFRAITDNFLLIILFAILSNIRTYAIVYYRIRINYKRILISNGILVLGYLFGFFLQIFFNDWTIIFISGELFALVYLIKTTTLFKFPPKKTLKYNIDLRSFHQLSFSNLIVNCLNYLDRFIITPIVGAEALAVYYPASTIPKMLSLVVTPMANVLLTYLSGGKRTKKKTFIAFSLVTVCLMAVGLIGISIISPFIIDILYPNYASESKKLVMVVAVGILLSIGTAILNPFILKNYSFKIQTLINVIFTLVYLPLAIILSTRMGLVGFCLSSLFANMVKFIITLILGAKLD